MAQPELCTLVVSLQLDMPVSLFHSLQTVANRCRHIAKPAGGLLTGTLLTGEHDSLQSRHEASCKLQLELEAKVLELRGRLQSSESQQEQVVSLRDTLLVAHASLEAQLAKSQVDLPPRLLCQQLTS